jgi:hypothetical protein
MPTHATPLAIAHATHAILLPRYQIHVYTLPVPAKPPTVDTRASSILPSCDTSSRTAFSAEELVPMEKESLGWIAYKHDVDLSQGWAYQSPYMLGILYQQVWRLKH